MTLLGTCNSLSEVRLGERDVCDATMVAEMIINTYRRNDIDHWSRSATVLLTGLILHTVYSQKDKSFDGLVNSLVGVHQPMIELLDSMLVTIHDPEGKYNWVDSKTLKPTKTHPVVASIAKEYKRKSFDEMSGIISTALAYLRLYRDPTILEHLNSNDSIVEITIKKSDAQSLTVSLMNSYLQKKPLWIGNIIRDYLNGKDPELTDGFFIVGKRT